MYANGGGMVGTFQATCSSLNIIVVASRHPKWRALDKVMREIYAVTRDIRQRVLYDPTAEFAGGFSGGGECAYMFARMRAQHVAGLFEMAGNEGRGNLHASVSYYAWTGCRPTCWSHAPPARATPAPFSTIPMSPIFPRLLRCGGARLVF